MVRRQQRDRRRRLRTGRWFARDVSQYSSAREPLCNFLLNDPRAFVLAVTRTVESKCNGDRSARWKIAEAKIQGSAGLRVDSEQRYWEVRSPLSGSIRDRRHTVGVLLAHLQNVECGDGYRQVAQRPKLDDLPVRIGCFELKAAGHRQVRSALRWHKR
jgi:hypothetical protein